MGKVSLPRLRGIYSVHADPITWKVNEDSIAEARKAIGLLDEGVAKHNQTNASNLHFGNRSW